MGSQAFASHNIGNKARPPRKVKATKKTAEEDSKRMLDMPTDSVALARSWIMSRELFSDTFAKLTIRQLHPQGLAITLSGLVAMTDYASVGVLHNSSQRDSPSLKRVLPMIKHTHTAGPRRQRTLAKVCY